MKALINNTLTSLNPDLFPYLSPSLNMGQEEIDTELWNVLKPLETTITFLNTGAHPDDERSDLLAYLSRGLGIKTATLIANRGEGGQNQLGDESGDALGILRTREMIEAAKIINIKADHLSETTADPIYDFGIEKTAEDTLNKWGELETYRRLIKYIRAYQPDVVMPAFLDIDSEHGHHRAIAILTEKAFKDAADPTIFPEQLNEVNTWQIKKIYLPAEEKSATTTTIEIGAYNPIYGMTYPQLGEKSRFMHKTQGMGVHLPIEPRQFHLELSQSITASSDDDQLFSGIPYDLNDWANQLPKAHPLIFPLKNLQKAFNYMLKNYINPQKVFEKSLQTLTLLKEIIKETETADLAQDLKQTLLHKLQLKETQLIDVSFIASGLQIETTTTATSLTRNQQFQVNIRLTNSGTKAIPNVAVDLLIPADWIVNQDIIKQTLEPGAVVDYNFNIQVAANASFHHAYAEKIIKTKVHFRANDLDIATTLELEETIAVLPDVSLTFIPDHVAVNKVDIPEQISLIVQVKNYRQSAVDTAISLNMPKGWTVHPKQVNISLSKPLEVVDVPFTLYPTNEIDEGRVFIEAIAQIDDQVFNTSIEEIYYDHIGIDYYLQPATLNTIVFELLKPKKLKIGYIESGFDKVADALTNIDFDITKLTDDDLEAADLNIYDTIVIGIRAYLSRPDLVENNERLLKFVEDGGNLVVQYHRPGDGWNGENRAPFKIELGNPSIRWRVTDEKAKVTVNKPEATLFSFPNKITDQDWDGWVQERGLYFPQTWDEKFETFVSMSDPNEAAFDGGILIAKHGKGSYIYTNLVFYRQIQNEVPGGYRIFTNLLSYGLDK